MHWTDRRERYRRHINGNKCLHPGSVCDDAISARIAEDLGFEGRHVRGLHQIVLRAGATRI